MPNSNEKWRMVLASQSPRRKELLGRLGVPFDVVVSGADEDVSERAPARHALEVARLKARAVADLLSPDRPHLVVAADTVVALGDDILGKPRDAAEAEAFLRRLSGRTHEVHTGLVLLEMATGHRREHAVVETTEVDFASIGPRQLMDYLATGDSLDKAGAYGIQGQALAFITGIRGCYGAVVGFPLARFCAMMDGTVAPGLGWRTPWQDFFS